MDWKQKGKWQVPCLWGSKCTYHGFWSCSWQVQHILGQIFYSPVLWIIIPYNTPPPNNPPSPSWGELWRAKYYSCVIIIIIIYYNYNRNRLGAAFWTLSSIGTGTIRGVTIKIMMKMMTTMMMMMTITIKTITTTITAAVILMMMMMMIVSVCCYYYNNNNNHNHNTLIILYSGGGSHQYAVSPGCGT